MAILEFSHQLYSIQENLGLLAVSIRLASNSPTLASSLGPNPVQVLISSEGTGSAAGGELSNVKRELRLTLHQHTVLDLLYYLLLFTASPNAGADYNSVSTLVSFNAGNGPLTQLLVSTAIIDDNSVEQTETFGLTGEITSGAALAWFVDNTATVQIIDDDGKVINTYLYTYVYTYVHMQ